MRTLTDEQVETIRDVIDAGLTTLPASALEKDIHLSSVLQILTKLPLEINLVFCGGTSLSKCYQAINRMSEDADFKFHLTEAPSKSAAKAARSRLKKLIENQLSEGGFDVSKRQEENGNMFFSFTVAYDSKFEKFSSLRETILIEFTHVDNQPQAITLPIKEIVDAVQSLTSDLGQIACLTLEQTIAEKVLSFLRRAPDRHNPDYDPRLVRHLYDIRAIIRLGVTDFSRIRVHFEQSCGFDMARYGFSMPLAKVNLIKLNQTKEFYRPLFASFVQELTNDDSDEFDDCWHSFVVLAEDLLVESF